MAKKKTIRPTSTTTPAIDTASEMRAAASPDDAMYEPTYDEIAAMVYSRYLERGAEHGGDFDDWLEAERALRARR